MKRYSPLVIAAVGLLALPPVLLALGLTMTSAAEVVIFAIACMALNILAGHTGLISFGHGAWFGMAAYIAGIAQRELFPGSFVAPVLLGLGAVLVVSTVFGYLILRRRGVYFSLMTLALAAMLYVVAFRWTEVTGGENGLGGITRPQWFGIDFESSTAWYWFVAAVGFLVVVLLWRFHNSPVGTVLVAIRENEQRARFLGYATNRYKLIAFVVSAVITGLAGMLLLYKNRMTSAEPLSVAFSGELLAMVVIGGMRSFLGPALGALFFILFREFLSIYTENWLFWFGLLFVAFIVFSPTGLIGIGERVLAPFRRKAEEAAAMASRKVEDLPLPDFLKPAEQSDGALLEARGVVKHFGGIKAVQGLDIAVRDRTLHALIGPNGAGKTTAFNLLSGMYVPDEGTITLAGRSIAGMAPEKICRAGIGRSFQITNLFPALSVEENIRLAVQARHPARFNLFRQAHAIEDINRETTELMRYLGVAGIERAEAGSLSYGGQRLLDMGLALATRPRMLLLDEPLAGLAAAERERIGNIIKRLSADVPVLLVEHDIDRVFKLADHVTVMNEGRVLLDGTVEDARSSPKVQEVYIGSGAAHVAAKPRETAARPEPILTLDDVHTYYGKSHILNGVSFTVHQNEIVALLGRNGAGKSTLLKSLVGIAPAARGSVRLAGEELVGRPPAEVARLGIGYVPQGRGLFAGMTVAENLELGRLKRRTGNGIHWDLERIFDYFPRIRERLDTPADYLSGGEQQMVAVARALSGDVRVLLLDEPFEGLAPAVVEQLFESFDRLRREVAIIIVDHHLDLALALSDQTVALERGEVIHAGPSKALREDLDLRRKVLWL
ncbi:branched-chain amino acid ABC transporter ATP-binding protein/permease [Chelatococcus composti]|jgi:ABC-type sugar transport system, ATPase component|uniref:ABC-type branched-subunit amino acid transport system ATPase component/ABC-type branched-subunit amino acid transport system permease subunit n=1 Tax=Chelatococcus composti TaxID=1743235 RepID=A0A841KBG4_9HYPH|nr:branched-chain amino acid ABC transporter ATP-binding protein/permease [Chelatococcus composti]MBB6169781.1 ABC-type branched-subunit amino acid transport system ATPase component/ABC-type branched-subunit amino acid transport system permease subunit [Chelatococcus composti]MBS7736248.1 ATP-binding cassette domain-containing protein [Chelatococcus composti]PZN46329.1 MAG: ABC transporter [Pseudomonadota bacterium]GGG49858.1 ABC transporter ATP-binding protein [Chelatococcus composti]